MQKYAKMAPAVLAAMLLAMMLALVGCSGSTDATEDAAEDETTAAVDEAATDAAEEPAETTEAVTEEPAEAVELQIFAANSLSKALEEVQQAYTAENPSVTFADTQYKSSGELNELLEAGSTADILISASKGKMDDAADEGFIDPNSRFDLFKNDLVMVTAEDNADITELTLEDIATGDYTVAVGDESVPAGNYANQSLSTVGCFNDPEGKVGADSDGTAEEGTDPYAGTPIEGKVVLDSSVGNVCKHAESGDVDVAFVYTSDVYRFGGVKVVGTVPADTHKNIIYPAAIIANSENADAAQAFLDYCVSDDALDIWQEWGFELA